jgi:hypothetical protein
MSTRPRRSHCRNSYRRPSRVCLVEESVRKRDNHAAVIVDVAPCKRVGCESYWLFPRPKTQTDAKPLIIILFLIKKSGLFAIADERCNDSGSVWLAPKSTRSGESFGQALCTAGLVPWTDAHFPRARRDRSLVGQFGDSERKVLVGNK